MLLLTIMLAAAGANIPWATLIPVAIPVAGAVGAWVGVRRRTSGNVRSGTDAGRLWDERGALSERYRLDAEAARAREEVLRKRVDELEQMVDRLVAHGQVLEQKIVDQQREIVALRKQVGARKERPTL